MANKKIPITKNALMIKKLKNIRATLQSKCYESNPLADTLSRSMRCTHSSLESA